MYIAEALSSGKISGDAVFTHRCQDFFQERLGVRRALLTTSCTDALEMTALLLDLKPGDEVIVPSFTFVSSVNAYVLRGVKPVFVDIRRDTLNLDERKLRAAITGKTKAIVAVHYAGVACEMDSILKTASAHGVAVIEDNAHGLFGRYKGRKLGTLGCMATLSFHETKNFTCGEGGALLINDPRYIERAEIIREKGTNRSQFFRGMVDKYNWVDVGSSFLPSDVLAAFLYAQLEAHKTICRNRKAIWDYYFKNLGEWAGGQGVKLPHVPAHCSQAYHMFYMIMPTPESRDALIEYLKSKGILSVFHYLPLHLSPMGRSFGGKAGQCPVTEDISDRLIRLPFYNDMERTDQGRVVRAIRSFTVSR
ncbi:MAG: dTDP-4-amino-4,6-dideoxy-D-glucose transaminase [Candidatus Hydrogenedentota bacterium]